MAEEDLLSKLQECIELHQDAARRAKLKFVDNKEQDKATLDSVISVLNTQLDPLGLKVPVVPVKGQIWATEEAPRGTLRRVLYTFASHHR